MAGAQSLENIALANLEVSASVDYSEQEHLQLGSVLFHEGVHSSGEVLEALGHREVEQFANWLVPEDFPQEGPQFSHESLFQLALLDLLLLVRNFQVEFAQPFLVNQLAFFAYFGQLRLGLVEGRERF